MKDRIRAVCNHKHRLRFRAVQFVLANGRDIGRRPRHNANLRLAFALFFQRALDLLLLFFALFLAFVIVMEPFEIGFQDRPGPFERLEPINMVRFQNTFGDKHERFLRHQNRFRCLTRWFWCFLAYIAHDHDRLMGWCLREDKASNIRRIHLRRVLREPVDNALFHVFHDLRLGFHRKFFGQMRLSAFIQHLHMC